MTTIEMQKLVGTYRLVKTKIGTITIRVKVVGIAKNYGRIDLAIVPEHGSGSGTIDLESTVEDKEMVHA